MKLSTRIKLLFGSTKCDVRGYHECVSGDWQPAKEYGRDFFRSKCDGCPKVLITVITKPKIACDGIVLTRWWGEVYPELYGTSLTAQTGITATASSNDLPVSVAKKRAKKKVRKKAKAHA